MVISRSYVDVYQRVRENHVNIGGLSVVVCHFSVKIIGKTGLMTCQIQCLYCGGMNRNLLELNPNNTNPPKRLNIRILLN